MRRRAASLAPTRRLNRTSPKRASVAQTPYHPRTNARDCTLPPGVRSGQRCVVERATVRRVCCAAAGEGCILYRLPAGISLCRHCRTSPLGVRRSRSGACVWTCSPVVHRTWGMQVKHRTTRAPYHAHSVRGRHWLTARRPCSNCCQAYANVRHSCFAKLRRTHTPPTVAKRAGRGASAGAHRNDEWPMPPSLTTPIWCDPSGRRRSCTSVGAGALSS